MSETFEWLPTECAPNHYPMFLVKGDLLFPNGNSLYIPDKRTLYNGWGKIGSAHLIGDERKPLPSCLELTWFSFTEDLFYAGRFELPIDRLAALFRAGTASPDGGARLQFDRIIVGMAPGGDVVVWAGARRIVREIAVYRAQPAELPWSMVLDNPSVSRADFISMNMKDALAPDILKDVISKPVPKGRWAIFAHRFAWTPQLPASCTGLDLWIRGLNGEVEWLDLTGERKDVDPPPASRSVPSSLTLSWKSKNGTKLRADITLDEDESMAAFGKLSEVLMQPPLVLLLEPSDQATAVDVFLQRGRFVYRFDKKSVKIYRTD